jgi:apolipoprotein D and lipocalin family protein
LDLRRYLGLWYEVARFVHGFEKELVGVTAEYSLRGDGRVKVVNSGFKHTLDGKHVKVKAIAWRADEAIPGALKVKFFHLFTSDYLVLGLDEDDYRWAVVGTYERSSLWFLAREREVSPELLEQMKSIAVGQGYDLSALTMVEQ